MNFHKVANLFPMMQDEEFQELKKDISENGQREPIWIYQGEIIDGRNRYKACCELNVKPITKEWSGNGSLLSFVISLNLHRRHLTSSQRAVISLDALAMFEDEAKERQLSALKQNSTVREIFPQRTEESGKARDKAAELFQTNSHYVSDAKQVKEKAPDLLERVREGTLTLPQAKREVVKMERRDAPPLPTNKYRVVYADPPWSYGNSGVIGETDHYGHVERHYPSMTIDQLCSMDIKSMVDDNAVLFMWVTSPLLEECFPVIKAWGFKYKTSFVWDKVGHNFGHYNSVRHELLLVCTRGSCTPDNSQLFDSVISIEKSNVHSEKPEEFRQLIDTLYTHGKRIELFARKNIDGWDRWGNE